MSIKNDSSDIAGQLRYIHYVRESCVGGLLTEMRFSLRLLDFHGLEERAGAEYMPDIRYVLGSGSFGSAFHDLGVTTAAKPSHHCRNCPLESERRFHPELSARNTVPLFPPVTTRR